MEPLRGIAALCLGFVYATAIGMAMALYVLGAMLAIPFAAAWAFIRTLPESMRR